jgi:glutamine phosphoribosylpyrophosphate amidotransferase
MCAIFGSFSRDKFLELAELNSYRGQHSFSISYLNPLNGSMNQSIRMHGKFDPDMVQTKKDVYYIGHIQAPTTGDKSTNSVHPSYATDVDDFSLLWHNGILKEDCIRDLQDHFQTNEKWDTYLLHKWVIEGNRLDQIDGTFSCLRYTNHILYLFRNEISPMFTDSKLNISSTKFEGATKTPANKILKVDFLNYELVIVDEFKTKENPYYFANGA